MLLLAGESTDSCPVSISKAKLVTHQSYEVALVGSGGNFPVAM